MAELKEELDDQSVTNTWPMWKKFAVVGLWLIIAVPLGVGVGVGIARRGAHGIDQLRTREATAQMLGSQLPSTRGKLLF